MVLDRMRPAPWALLAVALAAPSGGCSGGPVNGPAVTTAQPGGAGPADWSRLAAMRVLFGHQSVGSNILAGVAELSKAHVETSLPLVEIGNPARVIGPGITHFRAGRNGDPESKIADFVSHVDAVAGDGPDIAILKLCFADLREDSDAARLFERYRVALAGLRSRHPHTTFVHVTVPLFVVQSGWKVPIKRLLGRPIDGYGQNLVREDYNRSLRAAYAGREPVFDLALIESTRGDGSRVTFSAGSRIAYALAPEFTDDGGHLNAPARRQVAGRLLELLAAIDRDHHTGSTENVGARR